MAEEIGKTPVCDKVSTSAKFIYLDAVETPPKEWVNIKCQVCGYRCCSPCLADKKTGTCSHIASKNCDVCGHLAEKHIVVPH